MIDIMINNCTIHILNPNAFLLNMTKHNIVEEFCDFGIVVVITDLHLDIINP